MAVTSAVTTGDPVGTDVGLKTTAAVGASDSSPVGAALGDSVGPPLPVVGLTVGFARGKLVLGPVLGVELDDAVGPSDREGCCVGFEVGPAKLDVGGDDASISSILNDGDSDGESEGTSEGLSVAAIVVASDDTSIVGGYEPVEGIPDGFFRAKTKRRELKSEHDAQKLTKAHATHAR